MPRYHITAAYAEVIDQPQVYETEVEADSIEEAQRETQLTCISDNTGQDVEGIDIETYDGPYKLVDFAFHPITIEHVYAVQVADRMDGLYLFRNSEDAHRFMTAVLETGSHAELTEEPINHANTTDELIKQERES